MSRPKKNYSARFKAQIILELLRGCKTLDELAEQYQIAPTTLSTWHKAFQERAQTVSSRDLRHRTRKSVVGTRRSRLSRRKSISSRLSMTPCEDRLAQKNRRSLWPPRSAPHSLPGLRRGLASSANVSGQRRESQQRLPLRQGGGQATVAR